MDNVAIMTAIIRQTKNKLEADLVGKTGMEIIPIIRAAEDYGNSLIPADISPPARVVVALLGNYLQVGWL
jgi:hypothetical protein